MREKKLKVVHVSSEVEPFTKSGGLADVSSSLPKAIRDLGHEVIIITPLYTQITDPKKFKLKRIKQDVLFELSEGVRMEADFWQGELEDGLPVYFVDNNRYFGQRKTMYMSDNENARFFYFDMAALQLLKTINFQPDIIHCHDWQAGLIPYFLNKRFDRDPFFQKTASIFTIHNLVFQLGHNWWQIPGRSRDRGVSRLPKFEHSAAMEKINFAKRAILNADIINTVSEQYAQEILTKDFGQDLHRILKNREKRLFGIVNGIDYEDFNPKTDPGLVSRYSVNSIEKKAKNKRALQKYFKLPTKSDVPVLGMVTRIAEQKGIDLIMPILDDILRLDVQFVIMGSGEKRYESFFRNLQKKHPKKVGAHLEFDAKRATSVYAGTDMFIMPSRFEPCGLGQMISLRYGSIPIVRAVGGLADTITDFNPKTGKGNGFVFRSYRKESLLIAITRAIESYHYENVWQGLVRRGMRQSFSWKIPAKKYLILYRRALKHHASNGKNGNGKK